MPIFMSYCPLERDEIEILSGTNRVIIVILLWGCLGRCYIFMATLECDF